MKDYYDIYYLANKFDFDGQVLTEALKRTFENREHIFTIEQFEHIINFANDLNMQKKWKAFIRKINTKGDDYSNVINTIKAFLEKPFISIIENKSFTGQWYSSQQKWTNETNK